MKINNHKIADWTQELNDLEAYVKTATLPKSLRISGCENIVNMNKFVSSHVEHLRANNGIESFLPYLNRLMVVKQLTEKNNG